VRLTKVLICMIKGIKLNVKCCIFS
jgi:hypothetical protein